MLHAGPPPFVLIVRTQTHLLVLATKGAHHARSVGCSIAVNLKEGEGWDPHSPAQVAHWKGAIASTTLRLLHSSQERMFDNPSGGKWEREPASWYAGSTPGWCGA